MSTIYDVLDDLRSRYPDNRERGDAFERLTQQFLTTDPLYASRFESVWMWQEWPDRKGKVDTGIDLVATTFEGGFAAIQCKFYDEHHPVSKEDIDSFLSASGKFPFTERLVVSTTDKWSKHAEDAISDQQVPVARIGVADLSESAVDWSAFKPQSPSAPLALAPKKQLRPHQEAALKDVFDGFASSDRGRLIMACGTGKTFTALKIAERVAVGSGGHATVLFLVPSISLLNQSLREWTAETELSIRSFAVCSDTKVGKRSSNEDIRVHDLSLPATTDPSKLATAMTTSAADVDLTVVFSTYQSIDAVAAAQAGGVPPFDLIICDEAHRTTGVTLTGDDESSFVKVHDPSFLDGVRRLYMTATPRLFDDDTKAKASEHDALLCSMDDEALYGPEFHRLGFGRAVEAGLLTDYKVIVLNVDEEHVARSFQMQLADANYELNLEDAARIVGCWNGLAKRGTVIAGGGFDDDEVPMRRAVAFSRSIRDSKAVTARFAELIDDYTEGDPSLLRCELEHVDGTDNALIRNERLAWLKAKTEPGVCRILSNARCLSEGVDVPDLDAVLFLNPRNSVVDVVQSVGRVMRRAPDKKYGYIILPVAIPSGMEPAVALRDNKRYKVVWQVLQALRAHDDRFNAMVNQIDLNKRDPKQIDVIGVGAGPFDDTSGTSTSTTDGEKFAQRMLDFDIADWRDAIYGRIVAKVGERAYWDQWADDIRVIAERHVTRIRVAIEQPKNSKVFAEFVEELRSNLNPGITPEAAVDMLAQHLITKPVFDALFGSYEFSEHNPVSRSMADMLTLLEDEALDSEAATLNDFYARVRVRVEGVDNHEGRQRVITDLYENFFKKALPKTAEAFGIVYTPIEVVDFIIRAVNDVLHEHFDTDLSAPGVQVLDPFTGTGTFIVRLLQSGFIKPNDLLRKYTSELHANEILLLAYYIAAVNIEATFDQLDPGDYTPFEGIVLTDTFQLAEDAQGLAGVLFPENNQRAKRQKVQDIRVIVGNPPYSVGQTSANDANENRSYPALDQRIASTYIAQSAATKYTMYDSYIRAFRWATDRIKQDGIICFVSNGGWVTANSADGFRKSLAAEFDHIYVFNLRGNRRAPGEVARREGGQVFGAGSQATIAITLLIRAGGAEGECKIRYHQVADGLTREEKLALADAATLASLPWGEVTPNEHGDWVGQRDAAYGEFTRMAPSQRKEFARDPAIFGLSSAGVKTNRDAWCWNFSKPAVESATGRMVANYNAEVANFAAHIADKGITNPTTADVKAVVDSDPTRVSWSTLATEGVRAGRSIVHDPSRIVVGNYRPFAKQWLYFDRSLNEAVSRLPQVFPGGQEANVGITLTGPSSHYEFCCLMGDGVPDLHRLDTSQFFPRYRYDEPLGNGGASLFGDSDAASGPVRVDNITDAVLAEYRAAFGAEVTKDDVFYYVYGLLHSQTYREAYASDLSKAIPRIPLVAGFKEFAAAGRALAALHLGYESADPYPLDDASLAPGFAGTLRVQKMRFGKGAGRGADKTKIIVNKDITLGGIPDEAYRYMLGPRSALEWVLHLYQVSPNKASGIVNDPNTWCDEVGDPRYIVDLVKRVVTVSMETMSIVDGLPPVDVISP